MPITTYLANKTLDQRFGKQSYTDPSTLYFGLCTGCTIAGVVTGEPTIGVNGYARVAVVNNDIATTWSAAAAEVKTNANSTIQWPAITGSPWGTLTVCIISDAASGGNILWYGTLGSPIVTAVGMQPFIPVDDITITET
jgi:hypothetical protein